MIKEFKDFISRGNVLDLAVGVIMGAAFTAIVQSLVSNLINPLIGLFLGKVDLSNLVFKVGDATFKYGTFIESIINFLIIAFVVFLIVKVMNKIIKTREDEEEAEEDNKDEEVVMYLKKISDSLEEKNRREN
ncbi:large-conductance mechanosensitive channel [Companilactobacillus paralimentarius DSM 13238 = JCM 10415]|jgi:large conductance mechanosensitive channel protein|uniref:Large-conductance mechanosensitive channel n=1 Tax=Companilactobacillus paralimentarius DSM 13238 = JCM 10415 TaxID=1122151 RepID=A0A0R1PQ37_9LACO|nr:large-conductance mechanosensitive channel protein MscL [Companilactobacillus paralimentarius]KAE9557907.1 mechanosensitive ion channel protein MscL [Companilactobacillus paralimentarius]KRL30664.1 large-conductance mechanosensitive channel [Companilactobacillus paralimentarius DSM 13238 = JCM 10415]QFR68648.1 large-conductance mechanosensitive channel protein MscL [Companilactobacillus paralimentarius]